MGLVFLIFVYIYSIIFVYIQLFEYIFFGIKKSYILQKESNLKHSHVVMKSDSKWETTGKEYGESEFPTSIH